MEFNKAQLKNLQTISKKFGGFNSKLFKNYVNNKYGEGSWDKVNISIIETGKNNPDKKISEKYTAKEKEYYSQNGKFRNTEDLMNNLTAKGYKNLQQEGDFISGIDSEGNRSKWNVTGGFANKSVLGKESIWGDYKPYNPTDQEIKDIYNTEASANNPYFQRQKEQLTAEYTGNIKELDRLLQYSKTDYAEQLSKTNKVFANAMTSATRAYGQRNLLGSGIMIENAKESVNSLDKDLYNMQDYQRRKEEGLATQKDNYKTKYNEGMTNIQENQDYTNYFNTIKNVNERADAYNQNYYNTQLGLPTTATTPNNNLLGRITDITKK